MNCLFRASAVLALCLFLGCGGGPKIPEIVPVTGSLTLRGKPLAKATVKFLPMAEGLDGGYTATGVTDADGKFTMALPGDKGPGCFACETKVLITEGPMPPGSRSDSAEGKALYKAHKASLKNRPIPKQYNRLGTTPLSVTVSAEENQFDFEL